MSSFFSKTSDYFEGLSNKAKNRYKEKLQAVGLGIQDDPYKPENGSRRKTSTTNGPGGGGGGTVGFNHRRSEGTAHRGDRS